MMIFHLKQFPYVFSSLAVSSSSWVRGRLRSMWWPGLVLLLVFCGAGLPVSAQSQASSSSGKLPALELLERAHTQFSQGDYNAARLNYLKVLPSFPDNFDILRDLGACYFAIGPRGYKEAAKYYARAYHINPRSAEVANRLFECYMSLKKYREAAEVEMKLARLPHAPAEELKRAAEAYAAAGNRPAARQTYLSYLQRKPGDLLARCQLARLEELNKNYGQAASQYRIVLSSNPDFIPALVGMARIDSWQGLLDRSLALYDHVLRFEPDNSEALTGKAFTLLWQKRYRQAHQIFARLHRRYPKDADVARGLAESQHGIETEAFTSARRNGNVPELMAYYRQQMEKDPKDVEALKALTTFNAETQHCSESAGFGREAMEASNGAPAVELALARALRMCGKYPQAVALYRQYLQSYPAAESVRYELGDTLRRAGKLQEAQEIFRHMVQVNPGNPEAQVGLAQSLAASGKYAGALARFDQVLEKNPGNYDALQGKAYVLYWKNDFSAARTLFEALQKQNPRDPQNANTLNGIAQAEEAARWRALRPAAGASPQLWIDFYRKRLASNPKDRQALKGLAYQEAQLNQSKAAIRDYRHVLEVYPDDRDSKIELARLLSLDRQYSESIDLYHKVIREDPSDTSLEADLARVYVWSAQPRQALAIYHRLLSSDPSNTGYLLAAAQMEIQLKDYDAARANLGSLLAADPANRSARLELARLNTTQARYNAALTDYDLLLKQNPKDPVALLGKARISFYQGKLPEAHSAATQAVAQSPDNFSSVFLLASIEHAEHHRRKTLNLLNRAEDLSPGNAQVSSLRNQVLSESRVTLTTTAAYAREIGPPSQSNGRTGLPNEDLRMYTYGSTVSFSMFPKTLSYVSFTSAPSDSPPGPLRDSNGNQIPTGITGATAPYNVLYRQSTRFNRRLTVRGGVGFVRFGPGDWVPIPGQSGLVKAAAVRPVGLAGISLGLSNHVTLDLDAARSAITYTPVATRLGVIRDRLRGRVNLFFDPQTQLHLAYWYGRYTSEVYFHAFVQNVTPGGTYADQDEGQGGSIIFNRQILHSSGFSLDAGYEGYVYGFASQTQNVFMGFYNPSFYQRHEFVPRVYGPLWGPLSYDLSGGVGIQQTGRGGPVTRAWEVSPNLSIRVNHHLSLIFGYTHYNTAQILGPLRGNEVRFGTRWQY